MKILKLKPPKLSVITHLNRQIPGELMVVLKYKQMYGRYMQWNCLYVTDYNSDNSLKYHKFFQFH